MTPYVALLGVLLILVAIPFGLMLAPLAIGILIVALALRRLEDALDPAYAEPA